MTPATHASALSDEVLLHHFGHQSTDRDLEFIERYRNYVRSWASCVRCYGLQHDVEQVTWLRLVQRNKRTLLPSLVDPGTGRNPYVMAYLRRVAQRTASAIRREHDQAGTLSECPASLTSSQTDPLQVVADRERTARLYRAIASLPAEQQVVLLFSMPTTRQEPRTTGLGTMSQQQVADFLGITLAQVNALLRCAIEDLREQLQSSQG